MVKIDQHEDLTESLTNLADYLIQSIQQPQVYKGTLPEVPEKPKKRDVADLLGISERDFEQKHLAPGNIRRLPGQYSFARAEVINLALKQRRLNGDKIATDFDE